VGRQTDSHGGSTRTTLVVSVGNAAPVVRFEAPADGSFFEWGKPVPYRLSASDEEDGPLPAEQVLVQVERRERARIDDEAAVFPGLGLMRAGTCFACHRAAEKSAGPAYLEVARRYTTEAASRERLARKIVSGGAGSWGEVAMPPHPQHTADQARQMLDWIFSLASRDSQILPRTFEGEFTVPTPGSTKGGFSFGAFANGVVVLTATATDRGTPDAPPLQAESSVTLRTRRQHAAAADRLHRVTTQHNLESGDGLVARLENEGWFAFDRIRLAGIKRIRARLRPLAGERTQIDLHLGSPETAPVATVELPPPLAREARAVEVELVLPAEETALPNTPTDVLFKLSSHGPSTCEVMWVEFR
jgi:cytochrome c